MATGEGKGWRKGLTAATDPRIARAAAANTGKLRLRTWTRTAAERRRLFGTATTVPIEWSPSMAYVVGLTATDGCLLTGRRAINFKSADKDLVLTYIDLLGRTNKIVEQRTRAGRIVYHVQFSDSRLYRWFESIGLTPRKSLTLGALLVPPEFLASLVRGLLDGDGSISNAVWKADTSRRSDYYYEWLRVRFASASRPHLDWLKQQLSGALGVRGWIWIDNSRTHPMGCLSYGKADSIALLSWLYADPDAPSLRRKRAIWDDYARRHPNWIVQAAGSIYA